MILLVLSFPSDSEAVPGSRREARISYNAEAGHDRDTATRWSPARCREGMSERLLQFEWDPVKAVANTRKHGVTFESAATVFHDPNLLTVADLEHSATEERWFSVGWASNGAILSVVYLWTGTVE